MWRLYLVLLLVGCGRAHEAPKATDNPPCDWELLDRPTNAHLRGLCVLSDSVVWASGANSTVLLTDNGGRSWRVFTVPTDTPLDFRDIHAFSQTEAVVMSAGDGVQFYHTADTGKSWHLAFVDTTSALFFDGMDFNAQGFGIAFGDPYQDEFSILKTHDFGKRWEMLEAALPSPLVHEAGFAASGTGIQLLDKTIFIGTGGSSKARLLKSEDAGQNWATHITPMKTGETGGIYSLCFLDQMRGVLVGGNYLDSASVDSVCAFTTDGGATWELAPTPPKGYRSSVSGSIEKGILLATGRSGTDVSTDGGSHWTYFSETGFYACQIGSNIAWATGRNGKIGKLVINDLLKDLKHD